MLTGMEEQEVADDPHTLAPNSHGESSQGLSPELKHGWLHFAGLPETAPEESVPVKEYGFFALVSAAQSAPRSQIVAHGFGQPATESNLFQAHSRRLPDRDQSLLPVASLWHRSLAALGHGQTHFSQIVDGQPEIDRCTFTIAMTESGADRGETDTLLEQMNCQGMPKRMASQHRKLQAAQGDPTFQDVMYGRRSKWPRRRFAAQKEFPVYAARPAHAQVARQHGEALLGKWQQ
jgi:hypothetical protein